MDIREIVEAQDTSENTTKYSVSAPVGLNGDIISFSRCADSRQRGTWLYIVMMNAEAEEEGGTPAPVRINYDITSFKRSTSGRNKVTIQNEAKPIIWIRDDGASAPVRRHHQLQQVRWRRQLLTHGNAMCRLPFCPVDARSA